jgi:hypothetical protein
MARMADKPASHEDFSRPDEVKVGSDRGFGVVFAAFCALVAGIQLWHGSPRFWAWEGAAIAFAAAAFLFPRVLHPFNVLWFKFGLLLHHIVTPIVLGLMFYTVFTPIGLWMRMIGKRPLHLRFDRNAKTYWVPRQPPGPTPGSFHNQF